MIKSRRDETLRQIRRKNIWKVIQKTRSQNMASLQNQLALEEDFDIKTKVQTEIRNIEELRYYQSSSLTQLATKALFRLNHIFSDDSVFHQFDVNFLLETSLFGTLLFPWNSSPMGLAYNTSRQCFFYKFRDFVFPNIEMNVFMICNQWQ